MTPIQIIDLVINLVCDLRFRLIASLAVGIICALFGLLHSPKASAWAGGVGAVVTLAVLSIIAYRLNLPLGEPLPALPTDYTQFWIVVGAAYACWEFLKAVTVFLFLASILSEIRGWKEPGQ